MMDEDQSKMFMALLYRFHPEVMDMAEGDERQKKIGEFYYEVIQAGLDWLLSVSMFMDSHKEEEQ